MESLIPLLLASVAAVLTSRLFLGEDILFHFPLQDEFSIGDLPFYLILGIVAGMVSIYFTRTFFLITSFFKKIRKIYIKATIGGIAMGILIFCFPALYGEGYPAINAIIDGDFREVLSNSPFYSLNDSFLFMLAILLVIMLLKVVATTVTISSGGVGGIFAPTLFMGSFMGFIFSKFFNYYNLAKLSESNFTLVGMAGLMAGVMHAPLTAIFLIAEITSGYELFIPLMITASISYITTKYALPHSVYTLQLAQRGELITHHKDQAVLTLMRLKDEIETNFEPVKPEMTLGELVKVVARSNRNLFPVVDGDEKLQGIVLLNDIREIMFNKDLYNEVKVGDLMISAPERISVNENMNSVMKTFEDHDAWNLPVVNQQGKYMGFVSKSRLFSAYRKLLREFYQE